jgi:exosortase H (IPTLxxWG-CTERM-specific)
LKGKESVGSTRPVLRFVLTFVVLLAVLGGAYAWVSSTWHDQFLWLMESTATLSGVVLSPFSDNVRWDGQICSFNYFDVRIIDECTGVFEMVIFAAAVLAFPTTWRKKLLGLLLGIPAIYLFNLLRIVLLLVVGSHSYRTFEFMHLYFWQVTLIVIIATIWIGWLMLVVYREEESLAVSG